MNSGSESAIRIILTAKAAWQMEHNRLATRIYVSSELAAALGSDLPALDAPLLGSSRLGAEWCEDPSLTRDVGYRFE